MRFIKNTIKSLLFLVAIYSFGIYTLNSEDVKVLNQTHSISMNKGMELLDLGTVSTNEDGEYNDIIESSKKWWVNELGFDPWVNWTPPIIWNMTLNKSYNSNDNVTLGQTFTYTGKFPLKDNYEIAYIQMDNDEINKRNISAEKVLIHELGHSLGLDHEHNSSIMEPLDTDMTFTLTDDQRDLIKSNFDAGH